MGGCPIPLTNDEIYLYIIMNMHAKKTKNGRISEQNSGNGTTTTNWMPYEDILFTYLIFKLLANMLFLFLFTTNLSLALFFLCWNRFQPQTVSLERKVVCLLYRMYCWIIKAILFQPCKHFKWGTKMVQTWYFSRLVGQSIPMLHRVFS